jgi:large subunit ribosomal protein L17
MLRNMVTSLLKHERIHTTDTKAKVLRGWADHLITLARRGDLHARRQALAIVREEAVVHKLFAEAKDRFGASRGGYTRIVKLGPRPGDAAPMSLIELVAAEAGPAKKPSQKKKKTVPTAVAAPAEVPAAAGDIESAEPEQAVPSASAAGDVAAETASPAEPSGEIDDAVGGQAEDDGKEKE